LARGWEDRAVHGPAAPRVRSCSGSQPISRTGSLHATRLPAQADTAPPRLRSPLATTSPHARALYDPSSRQPPTQFPPTLALTTTSPRRTIHIRGETRGLVQQAVSAGAPASSRMPTPRLCAYGNNPICWADIEEEPLTVPRRVDRSVRARQCLALILLALAVPGCTWIRFLDAYHKMVGLPKYLKAATGPSGVNCGVFTVPRGLPRTLTAEHLGGHFKTGHLWTVQNRPFRSAEIW